MYPHLVLTSGSSVSFRSSSDHVSAPIVPSAGHLELPSSFPSFTAECVDVANKEYNARTVSRAHEVDADISSRITQSLAGWQQELRDQTQLVAAATTEDNPSVPPVPTKRKTDQDAGGVGGASASFPRGPGSVVSEASSSASSAGSRSKRSRVESSSSLSSSCAASNASSSSDADADADADVEAPLSDADAEETPEQALQRVNIQEATFNEVKQVAQKRRRSAPAHARTHTCRHARRGGGMMPADGSSSSHPSALSSLLSPLPPSSLLSRVKIPLTSVELLASWFRAHVSHPYPSDEEKALLRAQAHLDDKQIINWFTNTRKRFWYRHPTDPSRNRLLTNRVEKAPRGAAASVKGARAAARTQAGYSRRQRDDDQEEEDDDDNDEDEE